MERKTFGTRLASMILMMIFWVGGISAQETNAAASVMEATASSQGDSSEVGPLPVQLTEQQIRALESLQQTSTRVKQVRHHRGWFTRGTLNHPLTPRDVAMREAVYRLHEHLDSHEFVRVRLKDGNVWTGALTDAGTSEFVVKTGILQGYHSVPYRDLAEEPREVAAVGTHVVHGLEWTGVVVGCIAAIPLVVVFYPLVAAGVIQD